MLWWPTEGGSPCVTVNPAPPSPFSQARLEQRLSDLEEVFQTELMHLQFHYHHQVQNAYMDRSMQLYKIFEEAGRYDQAAVH